MKACKKKMIALRRTLTATFVLALALCCAACSSGNDGASASGLRVAVIGTYVADDRAAALQTELAGVSELKTEAGKQPTVAAVSAGDSVGDPMSTMAGMTKIAAMFAAGEIELMICDAENAKRYGDGGESYVALSEMFTEAELSTFHGVAIALHKTDDEGNDTGELSAPCGLDLSENARIKELTGLSNPQMFVIAGAKNAALAKAAFAYLAL